MNSNWLDLRNLQEQVKKAFCYQKLFWPFTVWINCSSDLKNFWNSRPSASNFKSFSLSLEQFFLTVGQNNFGNKIPFPQQDQEERTALEMLQDESFQLENYNRDLEKPVRADRDESKKYKQHMLKFIENLMWTFHSI